MNNTAMPRSPRRVCLPGITWAKFALLASAIAIAGCQKSPVEVHANAPASAAPSQPSARQVRATGSIQAVRAFTVQVPQITGQSGRLTLTKLIPNGTRVKTGDLLAEFDRTQQVDAARDAQAKFDDLSHQVRQKEAQNQSEAAKRTSEIKQAEADLAKASIQLRKGPVLADLKRLEAEEKASAAKARVAGLLKVDAFRRQAEAAALRILELQRDRQKVALERSSRNSELLVLKARLDGMVALETSWRSGSQGHAQEGDQVYPGQSLLKIFDPREMQVRAWIGEPDGAVLKPGTVASVYLDAYPDAVFKGRFHSASPVATSAIGSPIKNFTATFLLEANDPRLLPDLSAALIIDKDSNAKDSNAAPVNPVEKQP